MDRIVITEQEVGRAETPVLPVASDPQGQRPRLPDPIPLWARLLLGLLVFLLPLLCLVALILRITTRKLTPRELKAWSAYLLTLLIVSGFVSTLLVIAIFSLSSAPAPDVVGVALSGLDERSHFPALPAPTAMSGVELSSTLKPMVLLASPASRRWFSHSETMSGILGAALILQADSRGYLLATARHVADGEDWRSHHGTQKVMVSDGMNGWAAAQVVARHRQFDIALLWLQRREGDAEFRQPLASYRSVQTGEQIFVIGHPEGLNFSVSNGIVSRMPGNDVLQISAPVSPGNSGGPVYDDYGNLLGVVTSKVDRSVDPDAENLNFAVSTEALLHDSEWELVSGASAAHNEFLDFIHHVQVRKTTVDPGSAR